MKPPKTLMYGGVLFLCIYSFYKWRVSGSCLPFSSRLRLLACSITQEYVSQLSMGKDAGTLKDNEIQTDLLRGSNPKLTIIYVFLIVCAWTSPCCHYAALSIKSTGSPVYCFISPRIFKPFASTVGRVDSQSAAPPAADVCPLARLGASAERSPCCALSAVLRM